MAGKKGNAHKEPNFDQTGGNTAPHPVSAGKATNLSRRAQKKQFDYDKFGAGPGKSTSNNQGSAGGRRGGGGSKTFMNS